MNHIFHYIFYKVRYQIVFGDNTQILYLHKDKKASWLHQHNEMKYLRENLKIFHVKYSAERLLNFQNHQFADA